MFYFKRTYLWLYLQRIRNQFLFDILIKIERDKVNAKAVKTYIQDRINDILTDKGLRQVSIIAGVDCLWG